MVYVMVENESIGLSAALTLLDRMKSFPVKILVQMNEEKGLANLIRESDRSTAPYEQLFLFGLLERTCRLDLIFNSSHESISRAIHEEYVLEGRAKRESARIKPDFGGLGLPDG